MDVRAHVAMVFHLDKCIGCHTCSVACKNVWTDRPGAEYMWWNNVETKPGTGFPTSWEDQARWCGGFEVTPRRELRLRAQGRADGLLKLFYNPHQPGLDDYYEPWTYRYEDLFDAEAGDDQPTAVPISQLTREPVEIEAGPNWDDDLSGSPVYAENDPNLARLTPDERRAIFDVERLAMTYLPRICNHCANPACVASCPSGAIYKRGEDGVVLIDQNRCRGWRACVTACPYKKIYFNWSTGKSEKCILCYPRLESGQPPACFHACVGRIRYMGVLLYDASRLKEAMSVPEPALVEAQKSLLLDPAREDVVAAAREAGIAPETIDAARRSPVFKFVRAWELALPLHPEFRTMPMLYYVPPLLPVSGRAGDGVYEHAGRDPDGFFAAADDARLPLAYLASLFAAGDVDVVRGVMKRLMAVRHRMRAKDLAAGDDPGDVEVLREAGLSPEDADEIYRLTALATLDERFVLPPIQREGLMGPDPASAESCRGGCGFGENAPPKRGA